MSTFSINPANYVQSILGSALQGKGSTTGVAPSSFQTPSDSSQLSPLAQLLNSLQQLQQSDPAKYQQVTQQIATKLQSAAATAKSDGNTAAASRLTQLASDFTSASKTGQLPNIQDLAQALGGHGHHHHSHASSSDSSTGSDTDADGSLSPTAIILSTLASAGTGSSTS